MHTDEKDEMSPNSDFKELLNLLNEAQVRYLVVGGYAVIEHTEPRYTKDFAKCEGQKAKSRGQSAKSKEQRENETSFPI